MAEINLDNARAARREAKEDDSPPTIVLGGEKFVLPREIPFEAVEAMAETEVGGTKSIRALVNAIISDEDEERFWSQKPSLDDLNTFVEQVLEAYGLTAGESSASVSS